MAALVASQVVNYSTSYKLAFAEMGSDPNAGDRFKTDHKREGLECPRGGCYGVTRPGGGGEGHHGEIPLP